MKNVHVEAPISSAGIDEVGYSLLLSLATSSAFLFLYLPLLLGFRLKKLVSFRLTG